MSVGSILKPGAGALPISVVLPPGQFRLLLAFAVVVSHVSNLDIGSVAVVLFFLLSGYWTARIWEEKFQARRVGPYYLARYWRIAPLFLLVVVLSGWLRDWPLHWTSFTLLGLATSDADPTGVSWSLDIELQFYLLLPFVYALCVRARWVMIAFSLAAAAAGWWISERYGVETVAMYLPAFLCGVLTHTTRWKPRPRTAYASLAAFLLVSAGLAATSFFWKSRPDPLNSGIVALAWMLPLLPYVAYSLTIRSSALDRHFGNLSFPLYLVHFPTVVVVREALGEGLATKAIAVLLSCVLALALYVVVDRPVDRLRVRVTEGQGRRPKAAD